MEFKLKEKPEIVYWSETKQFTLINEDGKEFEIRVGESSKSTEMFIWNEPGGWDELTNHDIAEYVYENLSNDEYDFEIEERKKMYERMDSITQKFVSENGKVVDHKQIDNLVYSVMKETEFKKRYEERFFDAYKYVMEYLKKNDNE